MRECAFTPSEPIKYADTDTEMKKRTGTLKIHLDADTEERFYARRKQPNWTYEIDGVIHTDDWWPTRWQAKEALDLELDEGTP